MRFFQILKLLSFTHAGVYSCLLFVWLYPGLERATNIFGWAHGLLWIGLTVLMLVALRMRSVQWWLVLLVGVLGPVIPFAGAVGFAKSKQPN